MYSGHAEFLRPIRSSVVDVAWTLGAVDCDEYKGYYPFPDGNWGEWAVPKIESIRDSMRFAYENHQDLAPMALENSDTIRREFSWSASADQAVHALESRGINLG
jgi:hypothetical protein